MLLHCPLCHAQFPIEALTQDQAGRELLALMGKQGTPTLLSYLTLFRSEKRALSFERALKLAKEALALTDDPAQLEHAMADTVESIRAKREEGQGKPLKNHNYLKRVLESTPTGTALATRPTGPTSPKGPTETPPRSKTASAIGALEDYKRS
jgi:hypothetical protein